MPKARATRQQALQLLGGGDTPGKAHEARLKRLEKQLEWLTVRLTELQADVNRLKGSP